MQQTMLPSPHADPFHNWLNPSDGVAAPNAFALERPPISVNWGAFRLHEARGTL